MATPVNESVSVNLVFNATAGSAYPWVMKWRGRTYIFASVGLRHAFRRGRTLFHIFSVSDGQTFFRLEMDTETLKWKLTDVEG